jgi:BCD family chlorophyll transporter-like MFS transporter
VVLTTSTLNRVMVVELALAAMLPGALVTAAPRDAAVAPAHGLRLGRRAAAARPWIVGGMAACWRSAACRRGRLRPRLMSVATSCTRDRRSDMVAYFADRRRRERLRHLAVGADGQARARPPAVRRRRDDGVDDDDLRASSMTAGTVAGQLPRPVLVLAPLRGRWRPSPTAAFLVTVVAMWGLEGGPAGDQEVAAKSGAARVPGRRCGRCGAEADARTLHGIFVFVSMLAYSAQDLILEPFGGLALWLDPGGVHEALRRRSTVACSWGWCAVAVVTSLLRRAPRSRASRAGSSAGCLGSGAAMLGLTVAGQCIEATRAGPFEANVFLLGVANGVFSYRGHRRSMMTLASHGRGEREGTRMGLWGAAQAIAFGAGGFLGTVLVDFGHRGRRCRPRSAYGLVFALEALGLLRRPAPGGSRPRLATWAAEARRPPCAAWLRNPGGGLIAKAPRLFRFGDFRKPPAGRSGSSRTPGSARA